MEVHAVQKQPPVPRIPLFFLSVGMAGAEERVGHSQEADRKGEKNATQTDGEVRVLGCFIGVGLK